jgi:LacI family transcriptional regulator
MLMTDAERNLQLDVANIETLCQRRVDGLLLSISDERDEAMGELLRSLDIPIVLVDRDVPEGVDAPQVRFDHRHGMRAAAQHLWELGHRRVTLVTGGPQYAARERRLGVEEVFDLPGGELSELSGPFTIEHGERAVAEALDDAQPPTAIIAGGNLYMRGALRELRRRGLVLGRDISFVGCDDVAVAEFHDPPIAVVRRDPQRSGAVAAEVLLALLNGAPTPKPSKLVLPTEYVARPSVAAIS